MNFLKKIFHRSHNNITATRETSIDQYNPQVENNSNNVTTENNITANTDEDNNNVENKDSSVISLNEFGVTKTLHNLTNVAPIEMTATFKELEDIGLSFRSEHYLNIIGPTEATPVNLIEKNEPEINKNITDLKEAYVSNEASTSNDVIGDDTLQSLKQFEEALDNIEKITDFGAEFLDLDEFFEIFDELNPENEEPISINCSGKSVSGNDENKENLNITENVEIISISSTEEEMSKIGQKNTVTAASDQSDSDDGYNSSDFEFISETEANMTGFIINYGLDDCQNISPASSEPLINYCVLNIDREAEIQADSDPGEGPSGQNRPRNEFEDRSYRNDHNIPEGDDYLGLFQGIYNPLLPMSEIYFLENKSVRASAMNSQYDGIGFDKQLALRRHQPDSSEDEFADEAKESAKKILSMYPGQNRKRRRRHL